MTDNISTKKLLLFDVDGTLTQNRQVIEKDMIELLQELKLKYELAFVGGSDLAKQQEQLQEHIDLFLYKFSENGLVAYKGNEEINSNNISDELGEKNTQDIINFCLNYISRLNIPKKRGHFIEFRKGMLNISPIGRDCSVEERNEFEAYDKIHRIRDSFKEAILKEFQSLNVDIAIGGQISFDLFPKGWDKTYCLDFLKEFKEIYFFGDKTMPGGNDYAIYTSDRITCGYSVTSPKETIEILQQTFL